MCGRHSWCTSITERSRVVGNNSLDSMIQVNSECYQDEPGTQEVSATKMRVPRNQIRIQFGDLATRRLNRQGKLCLCHFSVYLGVSRRLQRGPNLATRCWRNQLLITRLAQKISTNQRNRKGIAYQQICFRTLGYLPQTPSAMQKRFHRHSKRHWRGWCRYLKTASSVWQILQSQVALIHLTLRVERWSAYLLQVAGPEESRVQNVVRVSQSAAIQKPSPVRSAAWLRPNDQPAKGGGHAVHWSHWSKRMISWHIMTIDSRSTMSTIQISRVVLAQFKFLIVTRIS